MINQQEMKSPEVDISKSRFRLSILLTGMMIISISVVGQSKTAEFGYVSKGDSIEFIFGQQKTILIGREVINLKERFNEIKSVNVAGDFNNWNPKDAKYVAVMGNDKNFRLTVAKMLIGKKGETRQFKFVINQVYWVEPPKEATNRYAGKDGYTNLTLKVL
jgi:hypothetical protein